MSSYKNITEWDYEVLLDLPKEESTELEYKSSKIPLDILRNKISVAASSFWNSVGFSLQVLVIMELLMVVFQRIKGNKVLGTGQIMLLNSQSL